MEETKNPKSQSQIPIGFRFYPTEEDLVRHYLYNKLNRKPLPCHEAVKECNLYGDQEPWEIWNTYGGNELRSDDSLFFFTVLREKSLNDSRKIRKVGCSGGSWKFEDSKKNVRARNTRGLSATKKRFRYENKESKHNGRWIMHEFSLNTNTNEEVVNYVLCRIGKRIPNWTRSKASRVEHESPKIEELQQRPMVECSNNPNATTMMGTSKKAIMVGFGPNGTRSTIGQPNTRDKGLNYVNNYESIMPKSLSKLIAGSIEQQFLVNDCIDQLHETGERQDTEDDDDDDDDDDGRDRYTDWAKSLARELLQGQLPQAIKEKEIEMLPNMYYEQKWLGWETLP